MEAPRKRFIRHEVAGAARFLTFSCHRRLPLLSNDRIKRRFVECLTTSARSVPVLAWVIMPEHVHLVILPNSEGDVTPFLTSLKTAIAKVVLNRWRTLRAPILDQITDASGQPRFWQAGGGYDRCVVGDELFEKIAYTHRNPIRRGLAATSVDWPWSSARAYEATPDYTGPPLALDLLPPTDRPLT